MSRPVRHLRLVDADTGQIVRERVDLEEALTQIRMLERDIAGKRLQVANLERDQDKLRAEHPRLLDIERIHAYWQRKCAHPRAELDNADFFAIAALLALGGKRTPAFAWPDDFKAAVDGAAYDPFVTTQRNGKQKRHDGLNLIFRNADKMRDFMGKAPAPKQRPERFVTDWAR